MDNILRVLNKLDSLEEVKDVINSVNDNQVACKEWLLEHLPSAKNAVVLGGWYGMLASKINATSVDLNPRAAEIGKMLYPTTKFVTGDAFDYIEYRNHDLIVCTSCEHMDQIQLSLMVKRKKATFVLQSNNYFDIEDHTNCKASLEEFLADYKFKEILYKGELDRGHYKRWMVIGR